MKSINKSLIKGSFILLFSFGIFNALNFLFHVLMARSLTIVDYGILGTLLSIVYVLGVFSDSILLILAKYSSNENDKGKLKNIIKRSLKKATVISITLFISYCLIAIPLSKILKVDYLLLAQSGILIFLIFFLPVTRGVMQGKKRFFSFGASMIFESVGKLIFGLFFVFLGFKVYGALGGFILGGFFALIISFFSVRDILKAKEIEAKTENIYDYTKPAFIVTLVITIFYSIDIIFVKTFFSGETAGAYTISSILAKTIFWGTQPISRAMFPMSAEEGEDKKEKNIFGSAFILLSFLIASALTIFYFFPEVLVKLFSGKNIEEAKDILFYLGIAMSLLGFTNIILLYRLSLNKIKSATQKVYFVFLISLFIFFLFLGIYAILGNKIFFYFSLVFGIFNFFLLFYCLLRRYDLGFIFFIFIECGLLYIFKSNIYLFSISFITASAIFLAGVIFLFSEK